MKSRTVAILLALFLGGFGLHKFYLNKAGQGICYLLFCWTFIPAFLAFIDFIRYIIMSDEDFGMKYSPVEYARKKQIEDVVLSGASSLMNSTKTSSSADELLKWKDMLEKGIITEEEYLKKKSELL